MENNSGEAGPLKINLGFEYLNSEIPIGHPSED
jgi:hypothetical protein